MNTTNFVTVSTISYLRIKYPRTSEIAQCEKVLAAQIKLPEFDPGFPGGRREQASE